MTKFLTTTALGVLTLALAAGGIVALVQQQQQHQHQTQYSFDGRELSVIAFKDKEGRDEAAKLALTTYDLSIAGFANGTDHWFAFPDHVDRIPASTPLRSGNSYRDLIGGLANLPSLHLGREPMALAVRVLSNHDDDKEEEALKWSLATLTVMTTEAQRLTPVKETVAKGWESGDARVADEHLPYVEHWDTICHEILRDRKNDGVWDGPFTELLKEMANNPQPGGGARGGRRYWQPQHAADPDGSRSQRLMICRLLFRNPNSFSFRTMLFASYFSDN